MPDLIEPARSGRAKCRGCGEKIAKDDLRFGEAVPNPFGDEGDESTHWFHLGCGVEKRPAKVAQALEAYTEEVPDRERLQTIAEEGVRNPKLALIRGAERAPSGRARCRECRELIEKAGWRLIVDVEDESMVMNAKYFVHASCGAAHLGQEGLLSKVTRLSGDLESAEQTELAGELAKSGTSE